MTFATYLQLHLSNLLSEQLQRFHFPGYLSLPATKPARTRRALNTQLVNLTPLSISLPLDKKTKIVQCDQDSYEAKIRRRTLKSDDDPKYDFGSEYRDVRAKSPSAVDEAYKAERLLQRSTALSLSTAISAENANIGSFPTKTGQSSAEARLSTESPVASELRYEPREPQGHARQIFKLDTPSLIAPESSPCVPSPTGSTKEQVAKITDTAKYRPTAMAPCPGDQEEEDTDYDCATESDLETHSADEDFSYTVDPEDEGYDSLQSRFRNVRIRKRQRDDVEGADDDGEAWQGAAADTARSDGGREHKDLQVSLAEEEGAHPGKKPRTARRRVVADGRQDAHGGTGGGEGT